MRRVVMGFLAGVALGAVSPQHAFAADLTAAPVDKAPPAAPAWNWTGFYLGAGVGIRSTQTDATVTNATGVQGLTLATFCATAVPIGGCVTGEPVNDTAFRLSPYAGFNWQVAPHWVVGIEGDVGLASKTTILNGMFYPSQGLIIFGGTTLADKFSVKTTWDASARGRIGYLVTPTVLVYSTGGPAWLHVESTLTAMQVCSVRARREPLAPPPLRTRPPRPVGRSGAASRPRCGPTGSRAPNTAMPTLAPSATPTCAPSEHCLSR